MKKLTVILTALLLTFSLASCGGTSSSTTVSQSNAANGNVASGVEAEAAEQSTFPEKNIKILVPFAAGGGLDITTRIISNNVTPDLFNGHSVAVECMEGGGGVVGTT